MLRIGPRSNISRIVISSYHDDGTLEIATNLSLHITQMKLFSHSFYPEKGLFVVYCRR